MLVKKELAEIPLLKFPRINKEELRQRGYAAAAGVRELKRSGRVLTVDIFDAGTRALKLRFFSDGTGYIVWDCERQKWTKQNPTSTQHYLSVASNARDDKLVRGFLQAGRGPSRYNTAVGSCIDEFVCAIAEKKRRQASERRDALMGEHFAMYPEYPADLELYCERRVFEHSYIVVGKVQKGRRDAVCGHCKRKLRLGRGEGAPGGFGVCPKCGIRGKYRGEWVAGRVEDKAKICIAHKAGGGWLILRWTEVIRWFSGTSYEYNFYDYYRSLHLGGVIYSYRYMSVMGWGWNWYRKKNGSVNDDRAHIYTPNLTEVFGSTYYHVDLQAGLENAGEISFTHLLDNLKNIPAAEYLFKAGLSTFAANMCEHDLYDGSGFSATLGVSRQYLPLYRKYNIDVHEHKIVRASGTWVSDESFGKFRELKAERDDTGDIIGLLGGMSFERFVNYFTRQKALLKRKLKHLLILYRDYISMAEGLKADLSRKSVRFPRNIKEAHDLILVRYNQVKHEIEDENVRQAKEKLYEGMSEYAKGDYRVVFPQLRSDFVAEGQSLNHCVGTDSYYKNHIEGTRMVFFVRQAAEPDKSFYTLEIDMRELRIRQLYGFGGHSPPGEVRRFADEFLRRLRPGHK